MDLDEEWQREKETFRGKLDTLGVAMQLFIEQAEDKGFGLEQKDKQ